MGRGAVRLRTGGQCAEIVAFAFLGVPSVACRGLASASENVSAASGDESATVGTDTAWVVVPGANVAVPMVGA